ncbi:MAG: T9SS type A sorting domain-containing protein [Ignavibacteriae bacterium]|nr:T9SS type A sorting domain-containing protein [Ignavibacteriota bacterium]
MSTGVHESPGGDLPLRTGLTGAYPNPFNPSTVIGFTVGKESAGGEAGQARMQDVRVVVYDILGREVARLAHGMYAPGRYAVTFDARLAASGVYLCRFTAGDHVESVRMLLLR